MVARECLVPLLKRCGPLCAAGVAALEKQDRADAASEVTYASDEVLFPGPRAAKSLPSDGEPASGPPAALSPERPEPSPSPEQTAEDAPAERKNSEPAPEPPPQGLADQYEVDRGIYIQRVYDFYDPVKKRRTERDVDESVIHKRPPRRRRDRKLSSSGDGARRLVSVSSVASIRSAASCASSSASSASSDSSAVDTDSGNSRQEEAPRSQFATKRSTSSLSSLDGTGWERGVSEPEVYIYWGVMVGKLLHSRVMDFNTVTHKAVSKVRLQLQDANGGMRVMDAMRQRAQLVVTQAGSLMKNIGKQRDVPDNEWNEPDLLTFLFSTEYVETLLLLAKTAGKIVAAQPVLAKASVPCRVFGDLHGQFRDLLLLLFAFGDPCKQEDLHVVFNGDFVDRGAHQLATIGLLFAMKITMPNRIWLVRGNHEDRLMNDKYGFKDECYEHLGKTAGKCIFATIQETFNHLPLACTIADRVLAVHGGLGDGIWNLRDLLHVPRPLNEQLLNSRECRWIQSILWSDPIEDSRTDKRAIFGVHASPRGKSIQQFGWNVTKTFCARNGLGLVIRSHQSKQNSPGFEVMHENLLVRVFSARDYEGHGNDGAVLFITHYKGEGGEKEESEEHAAARDGTTRLSVRAQVLGSSTKARVQRLSAGEPSEGMPARPARRRGPAA